MVIDEKTGLYGNYGLWHIPFWQRSSFILACKIIISLLIIGIIVCSVRWYIVFKRKKKLPVWDQVLIDLKKVKEEHVAHDISDKEFYVLLLAIVKRYLHGRFGYDVLGKTDAELIRLLEMSRAEKNIDEQLVEGIKTLVQGSEIVKFANAQVIANQISGDYQWAVDMVIKSIPVVKK